jgi:copper(I)-binding protein
MFAKLLVIACGLIGACRADDALVIRDAWTRASPPGVDTAAVYLVAENSRDRNAVIVSVGTPRATMAHLHEVRKIGDRRGMRPVHHLTVPAGGQAVLASGAHHIMLKGLARPLVQGETFALTLRLEDGSRAQAQVRVGAIDALAAPRGNH